MDNGSESDVDVLHAAIAAALEYAASVDGRRVAPDGQAVAALAAFDEPLPDVGRDELETLRLLHDVGSPATVASTGRSVLRLRERRHVSGRARQFVAGERLGPEHRAAGDVAGGRQAARRRRGVARRSPRPPGRHRGRVRHRGDGRQRLVPRRRPGRVARRARLGRPVRRAVRRARAPGRRRRTRPLHVVEVARPRRARPDACRRRSRRRPGTAARRTAARHRRTGAGCAPRRARSTPARSTRSTRSPTGWQSGRAGCTSTVRSACGRSPTRAGPISCAASTGPIRGRPTRTSG